VESNSSVYRNPDISPVFQKTRPFAADLGQSGEKHASSDHHEKLNISEPPGLSIPDRENHIATLSMRRINTGTEQRNKLTGITENLTPPVSEVNLPLRGTLATLVSKILEGVFNREFLLITSKI
jgi:hypothetical protein